MTETKEAANRAQQHAKIVADNPRTSRRLPNADFLLFARTYFNTNRCGIKNRSEETRSKTGAQIFLSFRRAFFNTNFLRINKSIRKPRSKKSKNVSN